MLECELSHRWIFTFMLWGWVSQSHVGGMFQSLRNCWVGWWNAFSSVFLPRHQHLHEMSWCGWIINSTGSWQFIFRQSDGPTPPPRPPPMVHSLRCMPFSLGCLNVKRGSREVSGVEEPSLRRQRAIIPRIKRILSKLGKTARSIVEGSKRLHSSCSPIFNWTVEQLSFSSSRFWSWCCSLLTNLKCCAHTTYLRVWFGRKREAINLVS